MSLFEALVVTVLGMSVVFTGLVLCISFINVFNRLARNVKWEGGHAHNQAGHGAPAQKAAAHTDDEPTPAPKAPVEPPTPQILAVIAATLEIEQKLYQLSGDQRLTIRRAAPTPR